MYIYTNHLHNIHTHSYLTNHQWKLIHYGRICIMSAEQKKNISRTYVESGNYLVICGLKSIMWDIVYMVGWLSSREFAGCWFIAVGVAYYDLNYQFNLIILMSKQLYTSIFPTCWAWLSSEIFYRTHVQLVYVH